MEEKPFCHAFNLIQIFAVGFNNLLVPEEAVLAVTLQIAPAFVIFIDVDESVPLFSISPVDTLTKSIVDHGV